MGQSQAAFSQRMAEVIGCQTQQKNIEIYFLDTKIITTKYNPWHWLYHTNKMLMTAKICLLQEHMLACVVQ